jgi:hypothetical protein
LPLAEEALPFIVKWQTAEVLLQAHVVWPTRDARALPIASSKQRRLGAEGPEVHLLDRDPAPAGKARAQKMIKRRSYPACGVPVRGLACDCTRRHRIGDPMSLQPLELTAGGREAAE